MIYRALVWLSRAVFNALDMVGLHVLPKHFYTPVQDMRWLRKNRGAWIEPWGFPGVSWDLDRQLQWLNEIAEHYAGEVNGLGFYEDLVRQRFGRGYDPIDAEVLHCFVRHQAPAQVIEVGSGLSTAIMLGAGKLNQEEGRTAPRLTCVEPYPLPGFKSLTGITHIRQPVQLVPTETFLALGEGDLLFIDSSHAVKVGSDVIKLFMEVIPRLAPGVFIHVHDIFFPYLYPRNTLWDYSGHQETALTAALLVNNDRLEVKGCLSALHYERLQELQSLFPDYRPQANQDGLVRGPVKDRHFPSSLWLVTG